jgi:hypothetical protein
MERYQAVLDQLKKAQSRGMETINNRLDFVVQSLEELIQEAKASVQGALPQTPDECLPVDDVEKALLELHDQVETQQRRADSLEERLADLEAAGAPPGTVAPLELLRTLEGARSQSELLREMLPALSERVARAVVLVIRDGVATAWSGIGFADGELLRSWRADVAESPALALVLETTRPVRINAGGDAVIAGWLAGEQAPEEALLVPVVLRGKLMGAVYVDRLAGHPWDPESAQTLVAQVCWLIDTLQYRGDAAPMLAEPVALESPAAPDTTPATAPHAVIPPAGPPSDPGTVQDEPPVDDPSVTMKVDLPPADEESPAEAEEAVVEAEPADETDAPTEETAELAGETFEPAEPVEPQPELDQPETHEFEPAETDFEPAAEGPQDEFEPAAEGPQDEFEPAEPEPAEIDRAEPPEVPAGAEPPAEVQPVEPPEPEEPEGADSKFLDEPPPVQPVQPPPDLPAEEVSEDEAQREEARRFARLLVSEIKLYNEEQVERGRESRDLYNRLQEDIDRSREMFDKRISPEIRDKQDFFKDELVRILADGDPDLLGM